MISDNSTWFLYLIQTRCGKIYTGITKNLIRRWMQHNKGRKFGGAKFLSIYPPEKVIYWEIHESQSKAMIREKEVKRFTHKKKIQMAN